jgi:adenylate cyclase
VADRPFPAYEGDQSYFFVSYAHDEADVVYPEMGWIREAGFNLWYDDGIHVGSVWRRALADALSKSSGLVFFCTERAAESENCLQEINFALDEKKPIFVVQLDETALPAELRLSLSNRQALRRAEFDENEYRSRLITALSAVVEPAPAVTTEASEKSTPKTDPPSFVVVPFTTLSNDDETTFLAQGIAGSLTASLSRVRFVKTVGGHHSDVTLEPQEVGRRRGVRYVLSGTVQRSGNRVRVMVRITEVSEGRELWVGQFDRPVDDLLDAQDKLVAAIDADLFAAMLVAEKERTRDIPVDELDAFALCARTHRMPIANRAMRDEVLSLLRRAVELDPNFAAAHSTLGERLVGIIVTGLSSDPDEDAEEALVCAARALAIGPNDVHVMNVCSYIHRVLGDEALALQLAQRVVDIVGHDSWFLYAALVQSGRSVDVVERATAPTEAETETVATACVISGQYEDALGLFEKTTAVESNNFVIWVHKANVLALLDRMEDAREAWERAKNIVSALAVSSYEKGMRILWRNKAEIVEPLVAGLRKLDLE